MSQFKHVPDENLLAPCVSGWKPCTGNEQWENGDVILAAVPVYGPQRLSEWCYEYSVVTIRCDEHYFRLEAEGELWEWELDSVDFWVPLNFKRLGVVGEQANAAELAAALRELHDFAEPCSHYRHAKRSRKAFEAAAELLRKLEPKQA